MVFLDFSTVFIPLLSISRSPIPAQRFTRKQIRQYSGEHELPDGTTLQELHIEHLSRIIMRNDGEEVVRDGEQSKDGEEVVCDEAVGNPLTRGGVAPPEESPPHQERHWNDTEKIRMSHWANHVIGATDVAH